MGSLPLRGALLPPRIRTPGGEDGGPLLGRGNQLMILFIDILLVLQLVQVEVQELLQLCKRRGGRGVFQQQQQGTLRLSPQ